MEAGRSAATKVRKEGFPLDPLGAAKKVIRGLTAESRSGQRTPGGIGAVRGQESISAADRQARIGRGMVIVQITLGGQRRKSVEGGRRGGLSGATPRDGNGGKVGTGESAESRGSRTAIGRGINSVGGLTANAVGVSAGRDTQGKGGARALRGSCRQGGGGGGVAGGAAGDGSGQVGRHQAYGKKDCPLGAVGRGQNGVGGLTAESRTGQSSPGGVGAVGSQESIGTANRQARIGGGMVVVQIALGRQWRKPVEGGGRTGLSGATLRNRGGSAEVTEGGLRPSRQPATYSQKLIGSANGQPGKTRRRVCKKKVAWQWSAESDASAKDPGKDC